MKNRSVIQWVTRRMRRRIPALALLTAASAGNSLFGVLFALGSKEVINCAVSGDKDALIHAVVIQALIVLGLLAMLTLQRFLNHWLSAELDRDWKRDLTHKILHCDYARVADYHSGELINRLNNDVHAIDDGVLTILPSLATMATRLVAVVIVLFAMSPLITGAVLIAGVAIALLSNFARKYLRDLSKRVSAANGKVSGFLQEIFEKLMIVQAMNVEQEIELRSAGLLEERFALQKKRWKILLAANSAISVLGQVSGFAALVWCAFGIAEGTMTFGELTAVTQLVSQLQGPFVNFSSVLPKYIALIAAGERLMELEDACRVEDTTVTQSITYDRIQHIRAEELGFSYGRDNVFSGCSFCLPKGAFAVIVGPSGIGKSTLLKLLLGIFAPSEGKLYFSGDSGAVPADRRTRALFAYVPQGNLLFSGTLRENLLLTKPDATQEEIDWAIYVSHMDAYLPQLPQGLDTLLGENAHGLSEGQAQRLSIARAVLSDAPILLLDEATSALDGESEAVVLQRIRQLKDKTCIAVTHRPGAVALADWKLEVTGGSIVCQRNEV